MTPNEMRDTLDHLNRQQAAIALAVMQLVEALKQQPGFDVAGFEEIVNAKATLFYEPKFDVTRMILENAGGLPAGAPFPT